MRCRGDACRHRDNPLVCPVPEVCMFEIASRHRRGHFLMGLRAMKIEAVDFFYLSMPRGHRRGRRQPGCAAGARRGRRACRLGRMRGRAAALDRGVRLSDVARRVPAGRGLGARQAARRAGRHRAHGGGGRLQLHGPAAGAAHLVRHRDGAVGSARQGARRAGVAAARLRDAAIRRRPMPRCCSATRRRRRSRARKAMRGAQFRRREIRLGPDRARHARSRRGPVRRRARGLGPRRHAAGRYRDRSSSRTWSARRRACRRSKPRAPLVRGAVRARAPRRLWRARAALQRP